MRGLIPSLVVLICIVQPAGAGITVSSYRTVAQANAYAPLDKSAYYTTDEKLTFSPAACDVSEDWSGTNAGGSENTWRMLAEAHITSTTNLTADTLGITGAGSFSYDISTTNTFVDPTRTATLFIPGTAADYQCYFTLSEVASYSLDIQLNRSSLVYFASFDSGVIFQMSNSGALPLTVDESGTLPPGSYEIRANASRAGPTPLADGMNQVVRNGSFGNFVFSIQIPEPSGMLVVLFASFIRSLRMRPRLLA